MQDFRWLYERVCSEMEISLVSETKKKANLQRGPTQNAILNLILKQFDIRFLFA